MVAQNLLGLTATSGATNRPMFQQPTLSLQSVDFTKCCPCDSSKTNIDSLFNVVFF